MSSFFDTFVLTRREQIVIVVLLLMLVAGALVQRHRRELQVIPSAVEEPRDQTQR